MTNQFQFVGGPKGEWAITHMSAYRGAGLEAVERLTIKNADPSLVSGVWVLRGFTSNVRYATQAELVSLRAKQEGLGRQGATCGALIPIRKTEAWWALAQDERRAIFEESSKHNKIGMEYLPQIARRLYHSRDLGEPFDFLTWFEYAPEHKKAFEELVARMRSSKEWSYVEREIDIRVERA